MLLIVLSMRGDPAFAQASRVPLTVSSPPSPVGAGARATGVGSAFIAIADDATAASWNPAGLLQLERPEVSVVGAWRRQTDEADRFTSDEIGEVRTSRASTTSSEAFELNFASAVVPLSYRGQNFVCSLSYQQMLSFERDLAVHLRVDSEDPLAAPARLQRRFRQAGHVDALSPAIAVELTPWLSVGAALNYWFDGLGRRNAWQARFQETVVLETPEGDRSFPFLGVEEFRNVRGANGTFGALVRIGEPLSVGLVTDLPFTARFTLERFTDNGDEQSGQREALQMSLPASYGLGGAMRLADSLVLSVDATYVRWDEFDVQDASDRAYLVSGDPRNGQSPVDPVLTVRVGGEQLVWMQRERVAVRAGAFIDPQPARGAPASAYGGAVGVGVSAGNVSADVAYQVRWIPEASGVSEIRNVFATSSGSLEIMQHTLYASIVVYL